MIGLIAHFMAVLHNPVVFTRCRRDLRLDAVALWWVQDAPTLSATRSRQRHAEP